MPAQSAKATSRNIRDALTEYRCPVKPTRWREEPPVVAPPKQTTREPINPYELLKGWLGGLAAAQCIVIILWWVWFCLAWRAEIFTARTWFVGTIVSSEMFIVMAFIALWSIGKSRS